MAAVYKQKCLLNQIYLTSASSEETTSYCCYIR